jgi:hypothetical protein
MVKLYNRVPLFFATGNVIYLKYPDLIKLFPEFLIKTPKNSINIRANVKKILTAILAGFVED